MSTYPRRPGAEASSDAVDVVELLRDPTDQAPNVRHLRVQHTFSLMTSHELLIQLSFTGEFSSARRRGDGYDVFTGAGLRLSSATVRPRCDSVEGGTAHG